MGANFAHLISLKTELRMYVGRNSRKCSTALRRVWSNVAGHGQTDKLYTQSFFPPFVKNTES